jgi:hypothetical protein
MEPITKPWWMSKVLWLQVITMIGVGVEYIINNDMFPTYAAWTTFADAVITAVLRIFFTDTKLTK